MADHIRRVVSATRGPAIAEKLTLESAFGIASASSHLRDALARLRRWSPSRQEYVAREGTSQIAVDEVTRALDLLDRLNKQSEDGNGK